MAGAPVGRDKSLRQTEPQAPPPTEATGNLSAKAQVVGGPVRGPEADRLLTLERSGSGTPAQAGDDAPPTATSHPCPVLELPLAWPTGCGTDDVPAFCFVCFHREEEEELLEEVPLRRSVPSGAGEGTAPGQGPSGPGGLASESLSLTLLTAHGHLPAPDSQISYLAVIPASSCLSHPGPRVTFQSSPVVVMSLLCSEASIALSSHSMKSTFCWAFKAWVIQADDTSHFITLCLPCVHLQ